MIQQQTKGQEQFNEIKSHVVRVLKTMSKDDFFGQGGAGVNNTFKLLQVGLQGVVNSDTWVKIEDFIRGGNTPNQRYKFGQGWSQE